VIHGDLRWDNCQVVVASAPRRPRVQFVDWETAGVGDPSWDIGSILAECLSTWLLSAPVTRDAPPDDFLRLARLPLEGTRPAMRAFWAAYVARRRWDDDTASQWLRRSMQHAGARLVQTACEETQGRLRVPANIVYMLQLSANVIERPVEAASVLLGLAADRVTP
jgi:aminoglycoside phosphotransferase (APT) family kinase protein